MRTDLAPVASWPVELLGEVADITLGGTPSTAVASFWGGSIPWMASGDVNLREVFDVSGRVTPLGLTCSNATLIAPPAVAVGLAGQGRTRGTVAFVHIELCTNQSIALLQGRPRELDTRYLFHNLEGRYEELRARSSGGGRGGLSRSILSQIPIAIPPISEQRRIVEILDTVDKAIQDTEKLVSKLQRMQQGLVHDLLTWGVDAHGALRDPERHPEYFRDSPIGCVPREWQISSVEAEFDISSGFALGPHRRPQQHAHPYLRVANVYKGFLDLSDVSLMDVHSSELRGNTLSVGDILVVEGHANPEEIGRCAMVTSDVLGYVFQNHLFRLRSRRLMPEFAQQWMNGRVVRSYWKRMCSTSSGLNTINRTRLKAVHVPVPTVAEQLRFCELVQAAEAQLGRQQRELAKLRALKQGLMEDLLTGRVRVSDAGAGAP